MHQSLVHTVYIKREFWFILFVAAWPFCFFWPYTVGFLSVGNDFYYDGYNYKIYFIASLAGGHLPLWGPMNTCGFPLISNPYVAPLYPLNILLLTAYNLLGGLTGWDYTLYTILGVAIYNVGLYCLLRKHSLLPFVAFGSVLIASMSLKLAESLRYPNAIHTAAWMPWLLLGIALAAEKRRTLRGATLFGVSFFLILTAGYPYFIVYSGFAALPYFFALLFPTTRRALLRRESVDGVG
jgi:hypothetical protein